MDSSSFPVEDRLLRKLTGRLMQKGVFQVPFPLSPSRQLSLGLGWLVAEARRSSLRSFPKALARELAEAARGQGPTVRRRRLQHKLAKANRAFTHFRWA